MTSTRTAWKSAAHAFARTFGIDIHRLSEEPGVPRLASWLQKAQVDLVVDVGANTGQFARSLREFGYRGAIISFEPLPDAYVALAAECAAGNAWVARDIALGDRDGTAQLGVAGNSVSSSLMPMLATHERAAPGSAFVASVPVTVWALDDHVSEILRESRRPFLKVDAQGYELQVLKGAARTLPRFVGMQLEMSLVPLYEGSPLMGDLIDWLISRGFVLKDLDPGFRDPETGQVLQLDGVFVRVKPDPSGAAGR